jgi:hypothetical protein
MIVEFGGGGGGGGGGGHLLVALLLLLVVVVVDFFLYYCRHKPNQTKSYNYYDLTPSCHMSQRVTSDTACHSMMLSRCAGVNVSMPSRSKCSQSCGQSCGVNVVKIAQV